MEVDPDGGAGTKRGRVHYVVAPERLGAAGGASGGGHAAKRTHVVPEAEEPLPTRRRRRRGSRKPKRKMARRTRRTKRSRRSSGKVSTFALMREQARLAGAELPRRSDYYITRRPGQGIRYHKRDENSLAMYGPTAASASLAQKQNRAANYMSGRGLYTGRGGYWMQKLFGAKPGGWLDKLGDSVAATVPGLSGIAQGSAALHQAISGRGAYTVGNDVIADLSDGVVRFGGATDDDAIVLQHTEYISDVYGPDNAFFQNTTYALNPGLERTFPWLSQVAMNYDEYEFKQLMFQFKPTTSEFAPNNGQVGQCIMVTQYNAAEKAYVDKQSMLRAKGVSCSKVTDNILHGVECDPNKNAGSEGKFVRAGPVAVSSGTAGDINSYDQGVFNLAISGIPDTYRNQVLGELHVAYTVLLRKKKQFTSEGFGISRDVIVIPEQSVTWGADLPGGNVAPGTVSQFLLGQQNSIGSTWDAGTNTITLPATFSGQLKLTVRWTATAGHLELASPLLAVTGNVAPIDDIIDPGQPTGWNFAKAAQAAGTGDSIAEFHLRVDNPASVIPATDNTLRLVWQGLSTQATSIYAQIDLEEYNTRFNYDPEGPRNALVLIDPVTGQLVAP